MAAEIVSALIGLGGALLGGGISSGTTLLINRGEREKHRRDRSWDLKREAYTQIIGTLDRARAICKHIADEYRDDPHGWDASKASREAYDQMVEYFHAARIAFHANRLFLSTAMVEKFENMNALLGEADNPNLLPPEQAEAASAALEKTVPEMQRIAIGELGIS